MKKRNTPKPTPVIDPAFAVAPVFAWYTQAFAVLWEISDQAGAVAEELQKPDSPWGGYIDRGGMLAFCHAINEIVDHHLRPPFHPCSPMDPMTGMKGVRS